MSPQGRTQFELFKTHKCKLITHWKSKRFDFLLIIILLKKIFYCKVQTTWTALVLTFTFMQLSGLCGYYQVSCHSMHSTSDHATFVLCMTGLLWIALFLGQSDCVFFVVVIAWNYTFLHGKLHKCSDCTALSQSESNNFSCMWLTLSSLGFLEVSQPGGLIQPPTITFLLFIQNMWNLCVSSTQLWYQFVIRACDVVMTSPHLIFWSYCTFCNSRLLPMKSKANKHFWGIF